MSKNPIPYVTANDMDIRPPTFCVSCHEYFIGMPRGYCEPKKGDICGICHHKMCKECIAYAGK